MPSEKRSFEAFIVAPRPHPKKAVGDFHLSLALALEARDKMGERGKTLSVYRGVFEMDLDPVDRPEDNARLAEARKGSAPLPEGPLPATVVIYTDGSITKNPGGFGGWAFYAVWKEDGEFRTHEASGGLPQPSTNNRAEMSAVLEGLKWAIGKFGWVDVQVVSDSQYVINGASQWMEGWIRRGWITSTGKEVENRSLWEEIRDVTSQLIIKWVWVKGHSGHPENEYVDRLAGLAAKTIQRESPASPRSREPEPDNIPF